jgi:hypothetical protein
MEDRPEYYRMIAALFIKLRGAPFLLSPSEHEYIDKWDRTGIPVNVVLEGLRTAYEIFRKSPRRRKNLSIAFCHPVILSVFRQYQDRRVGSRRSAVSPDQKYEKIQRQINDFLKRIPAPVEYLRDLYLQAESILSNVHPNPEDLENIDFAVEQRILVRASEPDLVSMEREANEQFDLKDPVLRTQTARRLLVKSTRERYQIPYVSPFYY